MLGPQGEPLVFSAPGGPQGELLAVRYSDDQPREPNGQFGSGGDSPDKTEDDKSGGGVTKEPPPTETWTHGSQSSCARMRGDAKKDIEEGRANSNALVVACRQDDLKGDTYRGIAVPANSSVLKYAVGDTIQLMPQSFSTEKDIAQAFGKGEKQLHNDKLLINPQSKGSKWSAVLFTVKGDGAKGWNIGGKTGYRMNEGEVVMQGHYKVESMKNTAYGRVYGLRQVGLF